MANALRSPVRYPLHRCQVVSDRNQSPVQVLLGQSQAILACEIPQIGQDIKYPIIRHMCLFPNG